MLISLLLSSLALACPDLSGVYHDCVDVGGNPTMKQMTVKQDGIHYSFRSEDNEGKTSDAAYSADGSVQIVDDTTKSIASCDGNNLVVISEISVPKFQLNFKLQETLQKKASGDLRIDVGVEGKEPEMTVCKKL